jgi:hypothetical protein
VILAGIPNPLKRIQEKITENERVRILPLET